MVQLPTVNSVPPRVMSRLALAPAVKDEPRKPASTLPAPMPGPCVMNCALLSLLVATLMVMVSLTVSMKPQSALPLWV
jgi:hypothetical protein